jgi:hypothetical protein
VADQPAPAPTLPVCPACRADDPAPVVMLRDVPVFCNVLWDTGADARDAPVATIDLVRCERCGLLWNRAFDPEVARYAPGYENSLHHSPAFRDHAAALAERLVADHDLRGTTVVEIGSGGGDFLAMLCERGDNTGIGFDPSWAGPDAEPGARVRIERLPYPLDREVDARLVTCQHVLEHLEDPIGLVGSLAATMRAGDTVAYFEVPDATHMLEAPAVWDLIYEHVTYFAEPTLRSLFHRSGFTVVASGRSFGDQYLWLEATPGPGREPWPTAAELDRLARAAAGFEATLSGQVADWNAELARFDDLGRVALWGAGSKGVTLLNLLDRGAEVGQVVDLNPTKHGRHVPGTGQAVVGPDELGPVDAVVVTNPLYRDEIEASLRSAGHAARVLVAG